jgi:hypothetical protein
MEENEKDIAENAAVKERYHQQTDEERRKRQNAAKARERTRRLHALGLTARGLPRKDRHQNRDAAKQKQYQANFAARHKAARKLLGLTISEFNKLPKAQRMIAMKHPHKVRMAAQGTLKADKAVPQRADNGAVPTREVRFCPHCGWNIDATRKAQAFVDGRVA